MPEHRLTVLCFEAFKPAFAWTSSCPSRDLYGIGPVEDIGRNVWASELVHQRLIVNLTADGKEVEIPCGLCKDEGVYMTVRGVLEPCICSLPPAQSLLEWRDYETRYDEELMRHHFTQGRLWE